MIVIPLQMWQFGFEDRQWSLGTIVIYNDGTGTRHRGNYVCKVYGDKANFRDPRVKPLREGKLQDWPRNSRPIFELVIAGLNACNYRSRKKDEPSTSESPPHNDDVPEVPFGHEEA